MARKSVSWKTQKSRLRKYKMNNLVISICALASFLRGAIGVRCHLGTDNATVVVECGTSSDKCVEAKIVGVISKVCYNRMDWSKYPKFIPILGCQNHTEFGTSAEICICRGDMCNDGHFKSLETYATNSPAASNTEYVTSEEGSTLDSTMLPHLAFSIHQTSTAKLIHGQMENFTKYNAVDKTEPVSVGCYVGVGTATVVMQCASDKCVMSRFNGQIAKVCYDQMPWSRYPAFDPRVGCQSFKSPGIVAEVCICVGDKCNDGGFETMSSPTTTESMEATTDDSMESATDVVIDTTVHEDVIEEEATTQVFIDTAAASGVHCYVGTGATKILMNCGSSSDKCVKTRLNYLIARVCYSQMDWARFSSFSPTVGCQSYNDFGMDTEICICTGDKCNDAGFDEIDRPVPEISSTETDLPEYGSGTITETPDETTAANVVLDVHQTLAATLISQRHTTSTPSTKPDKGLQCYVGPDAPTFLYDCGTSSDKCGTSKVHGNVARFCYSQLEWDHYPTFTPKIGCQSFIASNTTICICVGDRCNDGDSEQEPTSVQTTTTKVIAPKSTKETTTAAQLEITEIDSDLDITTEMQDIEVKDYESTTSVVRFSMNEGTVTTDMPETTEADSDSETTETRDIEVEDYQTTIAMSIEEISTDVPEATEVDSDSGTTETRDIEVEDYQTTIAMSIEEISTDVPETTEVDSDSGTTETRDIEVEDYQTTIAMSIEEISTDVPEATEVDTDSYTTEMQNIETPIAHSPMSSENITTSVRPQVTQGDSEPEATTTLPLEVKVNHTTTAIAHFQKSTEDTTTSAEPQDTEDDREPNATATLPLKVEVYYTTIPTAYSPSLKEEDTSDRSATAKSQASTTRKSGKFAVTVEGSDPTTTTTTTFVSATTNEEKPIVSTTSGSSPMCASIILMLLVIGLSRYVLK